VLGQQLLGVVAEAAGLAATASLYQDMPEPG
jgi:hypothetical protein